MDRRRRNDRERRRSAIFMLVRSPGIEIGGPGPANMVCERAFKSERALLKVVMMMRRQFCHVARTVLYRQEVHHDRRAAPDATEAARRFRYIQRIVAQLETIGWR